MKSGIIGVLLAFSLIILAITLGGGNGFFNIPSLVICIGLPIGLSLASAGAQDTRNAIRALGVLIAAPSPTIVTSRTCQVLKHIISYAYAAGAIGSMIGWIQLLRQEQLPSVAPLGFALSMLAIFYAIIISECILRPVARRIEGEIEMEHRHGGR